jgi:hypothetical protein
MHVMPCCYPQDDQMSSPLNEPQDQNVQENNIQTLVDVNDAAELSSQDLQLKQDHDDADRCYDRMRDAIGRHFEAALTSGKHIVVEKAQYGSAPGDLTMSYGPFNFDDFRLALPASTHQYYNCSHCRQVWSQMSGIAVLDDNGVITYPLVDALKEVAQGDPFAARLLDKLGERKAQRAILTPVSSLSQVVLENDVGGWSHFYGLKHGVHLREFNEGLRPVFDFEYVQTLFQRFVTNELNTDLLAKIFTYIEVQIGKQEHTALVHGERLVQLILDTRRVQDKTGRGLLWLWSTMQRRQNSWMRHINGSCLGIVLDGEREVKADPSKMALILGNVKTLLASATDPENHKQKTAPSKEASFDQAVAFLMERGLKDTMRRRLMRLDEVQSVLWSVEDALRNKSDFEPTVPEGYDPVAQAIAGLKVEKNTDLNAGAEMDKLLGNVNVQVSMSVLAFIAGLDNFESLRLSQLNVNAVAALVTTAATEGDHDQLLTFDKELGPYAATLHTPKPITYADFCSVMGNDRILFVTKDLPVGAIIRSHRIPGTEPNYLVHVEGFASGFATQLASFGTMILGSSIRSDHFGMSRPLCEISKRIPMEGLDAEHTVGGAMLRVGMVFEATLKNGTKQTIALTSWK